MYVVRDFTCGDVHHFSSLKEAKEFVEQLHIEGGEIDYQFYKMIADFSNIEGE